MTGSAVARAPKRPAGRVRSVRCHGWGIPDAFAAMMMDGALGVDA